LQYRLPLGSGHTVGKFRTPSTLLGVSWTALIRVPLHERGSAPTSSPLLRKNFLVCQSVSTVGIWHVTIIQNDTTSSTSKGQTFCRKLHKLIPFISVSTPRIITPPRKLLSGCRLRALRVAQKRHHIKCDTRARKGGISRPSPSSAVRRGTALRSSPPLFPLSSFPLSLARTRYRIDEETLASARISL
jgi:hypothetical protein